MAHYNHLRYHESIANLTPADVYFGRGQTILLERERIKRQTIQNQTLAPSRPGRITSFNRCARSSFDHAANSLKLSDDRHEPITVNQITNWTIGSSLYT